MSDTPTPIIFEDGEIRQEDLQQVGEPELINSQDKSQYTQQKQAQYPQQGQPQYSQQVQSPYPQQGQLPYNQQGHPQYFQQGVPLYPSYVGQPQQYFGQYPQASGQYQLSTGPSTMSMIKSYMSDGLNAVFKYVKKYFKQDWKTLAKNAVYATILYAFVAGGVRCMKTNPLSTFNRDTLPISIRMLPTTQIEKDCYEIYCVLMFGLISVGQTLIYPIKLLSGK